MTGSVKTNPRVIRLPASDILSSGICYRGDSRREAGSRPLDPLAAAQSVFGQFLGPEPEGDLAEGRLGAVASVDEIVLTADGEVAADRAGGGGGAVGRAQHRSNHCDRLV